MYYEFKNEFNKKKKLTILPCFVHLLAFFLSVCPSTHPLIHLPIDSFTACIDSFLYSTFCYILQCRKLHYIRFFTNESNFQIQFLQSNICYILISQITQYLLFYQLINFQISIQTSFNYSNCFKRNYV